MWTCEIPQRLDAFLVAQHEHLSRSRIQKYIEQEAVLVNGVVATKASMKLKQGDIVELSKVEIAISVDESLSPVDLDFTILYEDDDCFVIDKPRGIAAHPAAGIAKDEPTILHGLAYYFKQQKIAFSESSVLVHRLDRGTTGALLCAKTPEAHAALQKQFQERTVAKFYLAIVAGVPNPSMAIIDSPIGRDVHERTKMSVMRTSKSRESRTTFVTLDAADDVALLECELHTGRTHQIRVHLASVGYSILGDDLYNSSASDYINATQHIHEICLHAWKLTFDSPFTDKEVYVEAPISDSFIETAKKLHLHIPS